MNAHVDVAAYALGAMDDREASQFEDHLVGCSTCATELESMVKVVALMGDVTLADVSGEAPVGPYTAATGIPIGGRPRTTGPTPSSRRRKGSARRAVLLAAAAALVGAVGGGAVVAQTGYFQEQPATSARSGDGQADGVTGLQTGGEMYSNTDKNTGAHVDAQLVSRPWGTNVAFRVTKIKGPKECRLVAVRPGGRTEVLSTWTVPDGGYGFAERPQPLALVAATSLRADDMTQLKVQELEPGGDVSTLVAVRV